MKYLDLKQLQGSFNALNKSINNLSKNVVKFSADFSGSLGKVDSAVDKTSSKVKKGLGSIDFVAYADVARNLSNGFNTLATSGTTFEQSMANLSATTGITGRDLDELNRIARESGKATGAGATEAANAFTQLASKVKVSKVGLEGLKNLQKETVTLSQAGGIGMTEAASALAETVNQFGLGADQANRVVNVLAAGSQSGSAGIAELAASLGTSGAAAAATGVSVEQAAGALEVLSQNNLKGAEAGTALSEILTSMQSNLNMDLSQTGLSTALESLSPLLGNTTELSRIFGEANAGTAQYLIQNATSVGEMTTALTDTNVAQEQAAIRSDTVAEKMKVIQASVDDLKIGFYDLSGGTSAYIAMASEAAVTVAQLLPLLTGVGKGAMLLGTKFVGLSGVQKAWNVVTNLSFKGMKALNLLFKSNPLGLIVSTIGLVVTGFVSLYEGCDKFRKAVDDTVNSVKSFFGITSKSKEITEESAQATEEFAATTDQANKATNQTTEVTDQATKSTEASTKATGENTQAILDRIKANLEDSNSIKGTQTANDNLNTSYDNQKKKLTANLDTLDGIEQKITELQEKQRKCNTEEAIAIGKKINLLKEQKKEMNNNIIMGSAKPSTGLLEAPATIPRLKVKDPTSPLVAADEKISNKVPSMGGFGEEVESNTQKVVSLTESIWGSNSAIGQWASNATSSVTNFTTTLEEFGNMLKDNTLSGIETAVGSLQAMGALMSGMGGIVEGSAGAWLSYGANILAMVAAALPQLLALFGVESALAVSKQAQLAFPLNIVAMAATVAGIAAAVIAIPKPKAMAQGGIVYGNTFAQVGEYPGAANNPEVVAPLNRLRQLIQPAGNFNGGSVEFVIKGNRLVGVLNKEANKNRYF